MKLISKTVEFDNDTFAPVLRLVIELPIKSATERLAATNPEEFAAVVGKELLKQLQEMPTT